MVFLGMVFRCWVHVIALQNPSCINFTTRRVVCELYSGTCFSAIITSSDLIVAVTGTQRGSFAKPRVAHSPFHKQSKLSGLLTFSLRQPPHYHSRASQRPCFSDCSRVAKPIYALPHSCHRDSRRSS